MSKILFLEQFLVVLGPLLHPRSPLPTGILDTIQVSCRSRSKIQFCNVILPLANRKLIFVFISCKLVLLELFPLFLKLVAADMGQVSCFFARQTNIVVQTIPGKTGTRMSILTLIGRAIFVFLAGILWNIATS